jgi:hypothetical protein
MFIEYYKSVIGTLTLPIHRRLQITLSPNIDRANRALHELHRCGEHCDRHQIEDMPYPDSWFPASEKKASEKIPLEICDRSGR